MINSHTKGKWFRHGDICLKLQCGQIIESGTWDAVIARFEDGDDVVAMAHPDNISIISAAPDLLLACEILAAFVERNHSHDEEAIKICDIASNAIKKALYFDEDITAEGNK